MTGHEAHEAHGTHEAHEATDCDVVLGRMYEFLDSELPEADGDTIRRHLAECEPCLDQFDVEKAMKALVSRCCKTEVAPYTLRAKLEITLLQARSTS